MENELKKYRGIHPGIILNRILRERSIKPTHLAKSLEIPRQNIFSIIKGSRGISIPLALKVDDALGFEEGTFALLQTFYEIEEEKRKRPNSHPNLNKLRKALFWDTDMDKIDWEKQSTAVIRRIFERGNSDEQNEILNFYGKSRVERVLKNSSYKPFSSQKV